MPETVLYSSAEMFSSQCLAQAYTAAQTGDWPGVTTQLQQHLDRFPTLDPGDVIIILDLAIDLLLEGEFQDRWDAAKLFSRIGNPAIPSLIDLIQTPTIDPDARWFGVRILADLQSLDSIPPLMAILSETVDGDLQTMAITALGQLGPQVLPYIHQLQQPMLAAQVLSLLRHSHTIPSLLELTQDGNPQVRAIAIEALGSFHSPEIAQTLLAALKDHASSVRIAAAKGIGFCAQELRSVDWTTALTPLLQDLNADVCRQAALTLSRVGSQEAAQALNNALYQTPELGLEILRAISWIDIPDSMTLLGNALVGDRLPLPIRREAAQLLGRSPHPQASGFLETQLPQAPTSLQSTIVTALGQLGQTSAQGPLIEAIAQANGHLRLHILAALKNIDPDSSHQHLQQKALSSSNINFQLALREWS